MKISGLFPCTCLKQHAYAGVTSTSTCSCGANLWPIMVRNMMAEAKQMRNENVSAETDTNEATFLVAYLKGDTA